MTADIFQDRNNDFGFGTEQWHHLALSLSPRQSVLYFDDHRRDLDEGLKKKGFKASDLISTILNNEVYFFSVFRGAFVELRIWKIDRSAEEIRDLRTRPLQMIFQESTKVGFKMKTEKATREQGDVDQTRPKSTRASWRPIPRTTSSTSTWASIWGSTTRASAKKRKTNWRSDRAS